MNLDGLKFECDFRAVNKITMKMSDDKDWVETTIPIDNKSDDEIVHIISMFMTDAKLLIQTKIDRDFDFPVKLKLSRLSFADIIHGR